MSDDARSTAFSRIQQIFAQAIEMEPARRAAFVRQACGDDHDLVAELLSLLEHDTRADETFLRPPQAPREAFQEELGDEGRRLIGKQVGNYRILRLIASGGMGNVFEAQQEQPRRIVALKVMRQSIRSRWVLHHFNNESQILARLRHPNIAHVYDAGVHEDESGRWPYIAMEYVQQAVSIVEYARRNQLTIRDRLRLFAKVCDAAHHGHQKGVIHRDLKPSNILVDADGKPKVIDFGVARITDGDPTLATQHTTTGQLVGTIRYMSPEQCGDDPHDIDTRSDVYSLGVVLYELLTGQLPYETSGSSIFELARAIREDPPRLLATLNRRLRGDIQTIVLKALAKHREQRYQSAAGLAKDIRRYLSGDPVEARQPTPWTRLVRSLSRHPVLATATACTAISLVILGATPLVYRLLYSEPYRIELLRKPGFRHLAEGYEAKLLSRGGVILRTWTSESDCGIRIAELVERPPEFGGGRVAVLGFDDHSDRRWEGALCVFDAEGTDDQPLWAKRIRTGDILPELRKQRGFVAEMFNIIHCTIHDVFPDPNHPGVEIVAIFAAGSYSQRVVRIYDLRGQLLYEVWHDGALTDAYLMADSGLLVFAGDCHAPFYDQRGQLKGDTNRAFVIWAIRPAAGFVVSKYVDYFRSEPGDERLDPAWYLRVSAPGLEGAYAGCHLEIPRSPCDPDRVVRYRLALDTDTGNPASLSWNINELGQVLGPPLVDDAYKTRLKRSSTGTSAKHLPAPEAFKFAPFSRPQPASQASGRAPH